MDKILIVEDSMELYDVPVSRIRALLRRVRNRKPEDDNLYCGDVCINKKASKVYKKDSLTELTPNEYLWTGIFSLPVHSGWQRSFASVGILYQEWYRGYDWRCGD